MKFGKNKENRFGTFFQFLRRLSTVVLIIGNALASGAK
jgi:hypothetical protein